MAGYQQQYERMSRWLDRIAQTAEMGVGEVDPIELKDFFIAYFQTCYHMKDHLMNDPNTGISESDVESFVDSTDCLSLCADLCNATKHLRLSSSGRSGEFPEIGEGAHATVNASSGESSATYFVETKSDSQDAYELAKECRERWEEFLQSNGLTVP